MFSRFLSGPWLAAHQEVMSRVKFHLVQGWTRALNSGWKYQAVNNLQASHLEMKTRGICRTVELRKHLQQSSPFTVKESGPGN